MTTSETNAATENAIRKLSKKEVMKALGVAGYRKDRPKKAVKLQLKTGKEFKAAVSVLETAGINPFMRLERDKQVVVLIAQLPKAYKALDDAGISYTNI